MNNSKFIIKITGPNNAYECTIDCCDEKEMTEQIDILRNRLEFNATIRGLEIREISEYNGTCPDNYIDDISIKRGCVERKYWGKKEYYKLLCENCSATYESHAICGAVEKKNFLVINE